MPKIPAGCFMKIQAACRFYSIWWMRPWFFPFNHLTNGVKTCKNNSNIPTSGHIEHTHGWWSQSYVVSWPLKPQFWIRGMGWTTIINHYQPLWTIYISTIYMYTVHYSILLVLTISLSCSITMYYLHWFIISIAYAPMIFRCFRLLPGLSEVAIHSCLVWEAWGGSLDPDRAWYPVGQLIAVENQW